MACRQWLFDFSCDAWTLKHCASVHAADHTMQQHCPVAQELCLLLPAWGYIVFGSIISATCVLLLLHQHGVSSQVRIAWSMCDCAALSKSESERKRLNAKKDGMSRLERSETVTIEGFATRTQGSRLILHANLLCLASAGLYSTILPWP